MIPSLTLPDIDEVQEENWDPEIPIHIGSQHPDPSMNDEDHGTHHNASYANDEGAEAVPDRSRSNDPLDIDRSDPVDTAARDTIETPKTSGATGQQERPRYTKYIIFVVRAYLRATSGSDAIPVCMTIQDQVDIFHSLLGTTFLQGVDQEYHKMSAEKWFVEHHPNLPPRRVTTLEPETSGST